MNFALLKKSSLLSWARITRVIILTGHHKDFKGWQCSLVPTRKMKLHLFIKKPGRWGEARKTGCLNLSIIEIRQQFRSEDLWLSFRSVLKANGFSNCATQKCDSFTTWEIFFFTMLFSFFTCWGFYSFFCLFISCQIFCSTLDINN